MKSRELIRLLQKEGWYKMSQKGSHVRLGHPFRKEKLIVPDHSNKDMKQGTLFAILKKAGLKKDDLGF